MVPSLVRSRISPLYSTPTRMTTPEPTEAAQAREHLPLVRAIAFQVRRETGAPVPAEELEAAGRETLVHALRSFDAEKGVPLKRWVSFRVRCGIFDFLRRHGALPRGAYKRVRAAEAAARASDSALAGAPSGTPVDDDLNLADALASAAMAAAVGLLSMKPMEAALNVADNAPAPDATAEQSDLARRIREAVRTRPDDERHILEKCYFEDLTIEEAAREIGLSKSWGSRLHARALLALASALRESV